MKKRVLFVACLVVLGGVFALNSHANAQNSWYSVTQEPDPATGLGGYTILFANNTNDSVLIMGNGKAILPLVAVPITNFSCSNCDSRFILKGGDSTTGNYNFGDILYIDDVNNAVSVNAPTVDWINFMVSGNNPYVYINDSSGMNPFVFLAFSDSEGEEWAFDYGTASTKDFRLYSYTIPPEGQEVTRWYENGSVYFAKSMNINNSLTVENITLDSLEFTTSANGIVSIGYPSAIGSGNMTDYIWNLGGGADILSTGEGGSFTFRMNDIAFGSSGTNNITFYPGDTDPTCGTCTNDIAFKVFDGIRGYIMVYELGGFNNPDYALSLEQWSGGLAGKHLALNNNLANNVVTTIDTRIRDVNRMSVQNDGTIDIGASTSGSISLFPWDIGLPFNSVLLDWSPNINNYNFIERFFPKGSGVTSSTYWYNTSGGTSGAISIGITGSNTYISTTQSENLTIDLNGVNEYWLGKTELYLNDNDLETMGDIKGNIINASNDIQTDKNIYATGNIDIEGNFSGNQYYGEMFATFNAVATTITASDRYYNVTAGATAGSLNGFSYSGGKLTTLKGGLYKADASITAFFSSSNTYNFTFGVGGIYNTNCITAFYNHVANAPYPLSLSCFLNLDEGDVITLMVTNLIDTDNIGISDFNVNLIRIGDL